MWGRWGRAACWALMFSKFSYRFFPWSAGQEAMVEPRVAGVQGRSPRQARRGAQMASFPPTAPAQASASLTLPALMAPGTGHTRVRAVPRPCLLRMALVPHPQAMLPAPSALDSLGFSGSGGGARVSSLQGGLRFTSTWAQARIGVSLAGGQRSQVPWRRAPCTPRCQGSSWAARGLSSPYPPPPPWAHTGTTGHRSIKVPPHIVDYFYFPP